jgi:hypothetical protein
VEGEDLRPAVERDGGGPNLTVVVPTRDKAANVLEFVRQPERTLIGEAEVVAPGSPDVSSLPALSSHYRRKSADRRYYPRRRSGRDRGAACCCPR